MNGLKIHLKSSHNREVILIKRDLKYNLYKQGNIVSLELENTCRNGDSVDFLGKDPSIRLKFGSENHLFPNNHGE